MAAGIAAAIKRGLPIESVLRWGVAAGTANAAVLGPGLCTRAEIEDLVSKAKVVSLA